MSFKIICFLAMILIVSTSAAPAPEAHAKPQFYSAITPIHTVSSYTPYVASSYVLPSAYISPYASFYYGLPSAYSPYSIIV